MNIAIMQPYFLPYIGYFQLIKASDIFVFYDDVNYVNRGWINRNRILLNNQPHKFVIPCTKLSQNKLINEIDVSIDFNTNKKLRNLVEMAYKKAPFFKTVFSIFESCLNFPDTNLAKYTTNSVLEICNYLGINRTFKISSIDYPETKGQMKADRLIEISQQENANKYINGEGGQLIYEKKYFQEKGIELFFLKTTNQEYQQFGADFIPSLSILDVLMFNDVESVKSLLNKYSLI